VRRLALQPFVGAGFAQPASGVRLAGLDGVRAVGAWSILVYHCWLFSSPSGNSIRFGSIAGLNSEQIIGDLAYGVTVFFTLSGFLLYRPFAAALLRERQAPRVRAYLRNRALRILPAYWVILVATNLLSAVLVRVSADRVTVGGPLPAKVLAQDAALVQNYHPSTLLTGIAPAWSLAVEVAFYLTLPLLAAAGLLFAAQVSSRSGRRLAALAPAALILLIGLSGRAATLYLVPGNSGWAGDWHSVVERSFWCQADLFAFGMALAVLHVEFEDGFVRLSRWWRPMVLASALGGLVLVTAQAKGLTTQLGPSYWNTLMAAVCASFLALVVLTSPDGRRSRLVGILASRPFRFAGLISYSVFLWHEPLVRFLAGHGLTRAGRVGLLENLVELAVLSGVLAALTYRFVEVPALRRKRSTLVSQRMVVAPQATAAPEEREPLPAARLPQA
jgi:peptidoglycan/LPS O-acetylase OafA/YrhL